MNSERKNVFISYSSQDVTKVHYVKNILEANGISCWIAPQCIPTGSSYAKEIPGAIKNCKVFLVIISAQSQQSPWVPKELSVALTEGKCVLPFVIEDCDLTDMFNFFLTDVQRYYSYELQADSLRGLIERIQAECAKSQPSGPEKKLQVEPISDIETWVLTKDRNTLNREMTKFLTLLKQEYRKNPNAETAARWVSRYTIHQFGVTAVLETLNRCMIYLAGAAEAQIQLAVVYIHSGDKAYIKTARELLNAAVKTYLNQSVYDENAFKRIVYARWLIAVTYKQERNFGYANELCEELITYIRDENQVFDVPYSESLLLPQREIFVINKEEIMSDYLLVHMGEIAMNPKELFFTQRRLLELYLLNNDFKKAKEILPDLLSSFDKCKGNVDEIYHVGLFQNLFEYYSYVGDKENADHYFALAMSSAKKNYWKGKEKKLSNLKTFYE